MTIIDITGIAASVFTAISLLPQLTKIVKEKKAENVSLGMLAILFAGLGLWIWYGSLKNDWIIIASNAVSFVINTVLVFFALKYRNKKTR